MLAPELIAKIKHIELRAGFLATESLVGQYISAFKGQGVEFDEVREYNPGDDIRLIDWNVTARMNTPFIKILKEEREMTLMLIVDLSRSLYFGTSKKTKYEQAIEITAVLAFLAIKNNDKVGLIVFSDAVEHYIPPKKGRAHVWNIIRTILTYKPEGKGTNISSALNFLLNVSKRKATCFLISDFISKDFDKILLQTSKRHDLICINIHDKKELQIPRVGFCEFKDSETGERFIIDTSNKDFNKKYFQIEQQRRQDFNQFSKRLEGFNLTTDGDIIKPLENFMNKRKKVKKR